MLGGESALVDAVDVLGVPRAERYPSTFLLSELLAAMAWASAWVIPLPVILNRFANLLLVLVAIAFAFAFAVLLVGVCCCI